MTAIMSRFARGFALAGGGVLTFLILLSCVSIIGRLINTMLHGDFFQGAMPSFADALLALGIGPVKGTYEIVEAGVAFAVFAFLPLCQLNGAHASVDIFTSSLPERIMRIMRAVTEAVFAAILLLLAWQLTLGMLSKLRTGQESFILGFPVWWGYAASCVGAWAAALTGIYVAAARFVGADLPEEGADH